jgi:hypothetical protein
MNLTISQLTILNKRTIVSVTFSLLLSLCLLSTLFIDTALAQPQTNKIAIIAWQLTVRNSHAAIGCANWDVYAQLFYSDPFTSRNIIQKILDDCVDEDNTYHMEPTTAIVEEYPPNEWRRLIFYGYNEDWVGDKVLAESVELLLPPPTYVAYYTVEGNAWNGEPWNWDYTVYPVQVNNCRHPDWIRIGGLCSLPPGQYYTFPGQQFWTSGFPPDPDLEGCGWPFC